MLRVLNLFLPLCLFFSSVVWTYNAKYATIELAEELRRIQRQITKEEELIAVLDSEWQFINSPARLQAQKEVTFPEMIPATALQFSKGDDIPLLPLRSRRMNLEATSSSPTLAASSSPTLESIFFQAAQDE